MATHSSILAWRIPGTGEPGGLPSMGSHSVGHDWSDLAAAGVVSVFPVSRCNIGDSGDVVLERYLIPGLERSHGGGNDNPLQYSCWKKIPGTEEPGGLQSMGSQKVKHGWVIEQSQVWYPPLNQREEPECCLTLLSIPGLHRGLAYTVVDVFCIIN